MPAKRGSHRRRTSISGTTVVNTTMAMQDRGPIMNRVTAKPLTISTGWLSPPGEAPPHPQSRKLRLSKHPSAAHGPPVHVAGSRVTERSRRGHKEEA
jgi:hypothetical protein